ncbi:MAG: DUF1311 domain-containing protein [Methylococcales bacterium]|nr:DUF1311 domain-containing protein [Methylococcales bacterium]
MNIGDISFYTGILLFFIGILGGGIEIKELKIPQITGAPRYACFVGSILLLILGLHIKKELPNFFPSNVPSDTVVNTANIQTKTAVATPTGALSSPSSDHSIGSSKAIPPTIPSNSGTQTENLELAKYKAKEQLDEANKRIDIVWNAPTKTIRDELLPEQQEWLEKRENDCTFQASTEQPVDKVRQEVVKLNCMVAMTDPRTEELTQQIAAIEQSIKSTQTSDSEPMPKIPNSIPMSTDGDTAQTELDEANKRINVVWNTATKIIRDELLPEQREWLKKRENDCTLQATAEQLQMQEAAKLHCMAVMTDPRTEELKQRIAAISLLE